MVQPLIFQGVSPLAHRNLSFFNELVPLANIKSPGTLRLSRRGWSNPKAPFYFPKARSMGRNLWNFVGANGSLRQTNIAMGNPPFEDVSPIKDWWFSIAMLVTTRG